MNRTMVIQKSARTIYFISLILFFFCSKSQSQDFTPQQVYEKVDNSIVVLYSYDFKKEYSKQGSGVILNDSGLIVTNLHVFEECEDLVISHKSVKYDDLEIIDYDYDKDILLFRVSDLSLSPIEIGSSDNLKIGEKIYAIGSPLGYENSISEGIVSGKRPSRYYTKDLLQITASISPGSSGGAIVDSKGRLIGISTFFYEEGQNMNFAIPIDEIIELKNSCSYSPLRISANSDFIKGYNAYHAREYEISVNYYSMFLRSISDDPAAYYNRALSYNKLGEYYKSISDCNAAIELGNYDPGVLICRGRAYQGLEQFEKAFEDANKAISMDAGSAVLYNARGEMSMDVGNYSKALLDFEKAVNLENDVPLYYRNRGIALEYTGDLSGAMVNYNKAIELFPEYYSAYYNRARLFNDLNQFDNSVMDYIKCIELYPEDRYIYNNLGWVYFNKGDYRNAIKYLEEALTIEKQDWDAALGIATSYYQIGNKTKAQVYLHQAKRIQPVLKNGIQGLKKMENEGYSYKKRQKEIIEEMFDDLD